MNEMACEMACSLTEAHYLEILRAFQQEGYRFVSYAGFDPSAERQVILRHDIDLALDDALRVARLEASAGITSAYHILLTAEVYNPASAQGQAILREIRSLGHRVGLHVDPPALEAGRAPDESPAQALGRLLALARDILGPVDSYSSHRPATYGEQDALWPRNLPFVAPPCADEWRSRMLYRSDSRREWRQGCICRELPALAGRSLQLLTHPIWWTPQPQTRDDLLARYVERAAAVADGYLADNLSFYKRP